MSIRFSILLLCLHPMILWAAPQKSILSHRLSYKSLPKKDYRTLRTLERVPTHKIPKTKDLGIKEVDAYLSSSRGFSLYYPGKKKPAVVTKDKVKISWKGRVIVGKGSNGILFHGPSSANYILQPRSYIKMNKAQGEPVLRLNEGGVWIHRLNTEVSKVLETRVSSLRVRLPGSGNSFVGRSVIKNKEYVSVTCLDGNMSVFYEGVEFPLPPGFTLKAERTLGETSLDLSFVATSVKDIEWFAHRYRRLVVGVDFKKLSFADLYKQRLYLTFIWGTKILWSYMKPNKEEVLIFGDVFSLVGLNRDSERIYRLWEKTYGQDPSLFWRRTISAFKRGDYNMALRYLNRVPREFIRSEKAEASEHFYRGVISFHKKKYRRAEALFDKALSLGLLASQEIAAETYLDLLETQRDPEVRFPFEMGYTNNAYYRGASQRNSAYPVDASAHYSGGAYVDFFDDSYITSKVNKWKLSLGASTVQFTEDTLKPLSLNVGVLSFHWSQRQYPDFFLDGASLYAKHGLMDGEAAFTQMGVLLDLGDLIWDMSLVIDGKERVETNQSASFLSQEYLFSETEMFGMDFEHFVTGSQKIAFVTSDIQGNEFAVGYRLKDPPPEKDDGWHQTWDLSYKILQWEDPYSISVMGYKGGYNFLWKGGALSPGWHYGLEKVSLSRIGDRRYFDLRVTATAVF